MSVLVLVDWCKLSEVMAFNVSHSADSPGTSLFPFNDVRLANFASKKVEYVEHYLVCRQEEGIVFRNSGVNTTTLVDFMLMRLLDMGRYIAHANDDTCPSPRHQPPPGIGRNIATTSTGIGGHLATTSTGIGRNIATTSTGIGGHLATTSTGMGGHLATTSTGMGGHFATTSTGMGGHLATTSTGMGETEGSMGGGNDLDWLFDTEKESQDEIRLVYDSWTNNNDTPTIGPDSIQNDPDELLPSISLSPEDSAAWKIIENVQVGDYNTHGMCRLFNGGQGSSSSGQFLGYSALEPYHCNDNANANAKLFNISKYSSIPFGDILMLDVQGVDNNILHHLPEMPKKVPGVSLDTPDASFGGITNARFQDAKMDLVDVSLQMSLDPHLTNHLRPAFTDSSSPHHGRINIVHVFREAFRLFDMRIWVVAPQEWRPIDLSGFLSNTFNLGNWSGDSMQYLDDSSVAFSPFWAKEQTASGWNVEVVPAGSVVQTSRACSVTGDGSGCLSWMVCPVLRLEECVKTEISTANDVRDKRKIGWPIKFNRSFSLGHLVLRTATVNRLSQENFLFRENILHLIRSVARMLYDSEKYHLNELRQRGHKFVEADITEHVADIEFSPVTYTCRACFGPLGCYAFFVGRLSNEEQNHKLCPACCVVMMDDETKKMKETKKKKTKKDLEELLHLRLVSLHDAYHGGMESCT